MIQITLDTTAIYRYRAASAATLAQSTALRERSGARGVGLSAA